MTSPPEPGGIPRHRYIDWGRGVAVLIMIGAHTLDAWTDRSSRSGPAFGYLTMVGGFAAPLFLWLAGFGLVFSAERIIAATGSRRKATAAVVRRGLEIFVLAFLFRLQAFVVSPGSRALTIFRVDILNVMGPTIAVAGIIWGLSCGPRRAILACAAVATAAAMVTPVVRSAASVDGLPLWVQWHLRPSGDHTTFTLFPWAGFVFAGAACGSLLTLATTAGSERRAIAASALCGGLLLGTGFYAASLPTIYRASSFWTSSPTYFAVRLGLILVTLGGLFAAAPLASRWVVPFDILEKFGRNSLFIYWIHVEIVYGYATWILHRRLPIWGTVGAYVLFCAVMYFSVQLRDRLVQFWRPSRTAKTAARPVTT